MMALSVGILAHTPEKDPDAPKGQTSKAWRETSEATQAAVIEVVAAARAKKADQFKKAYINMDKACTSCHEIYRVELD
jgi:cytochrome c556